MLNQRPSTEKKSLFARRRALSAELSAAPWALGAGFALAITGATELGRVAMLTYAAASGALHGLPAAHLLWLAPELAHDLAILIGTTLLVGGILRLSARRAAWLGDLLAYVLLL